MSTVENHKGGNVSRLVNRLSQEQSQLLPKAEVAVRKNLPNKKQKFCKARYSYAAEQQDELTFDEGIVIEAIEDVEDGWMRGKIWNTKKAGLFPTNFVAFLTDEEVENELGIKSTPHASPASSSTTITSASKPSMEEKKEEKKADQLPAKKEPLIATSRRAPSTSSATGGEFFDDSFDRLVKQDKLEKALVLYSYSATQADEIDLLEHTTVLVLDKHCSDDGWYLGEYQGQRGVFPSNFVQLIEKPATSTPATSTPAPPTPPPVKPPKPLMSSAREYPKPAYSVSSTEPKTKSSDTSLESNELSSKSTSFASTADIYGAKHSAFETSSKTSQGETKQISFGPPLTSSSSTNNNAIGASSKIKNLQNTLFSGRQPPKPGDKPVRPVTTILDNYIGPESDAENANEKDPSAEKMSHPQRDRPRQANKRPPSMMPAVTSDSSTSVTNGVSSGAVATNFPVKESPPVVTQKPALVPLNSNKKVETTPTKEPKSTYKVTHTETVLTPTKKVTSGGHDALLPSASSTHSYSPMPIVSEEEPYSAKRYNQMAKTFNEMLKDFNNLKLEFTTMKQEVQQLRKQSMC